MATAAKRPVASLDVRINAVAASLVLHDNLAKIARRNCWPSRPSAKRSVERLGEWEVTNASAFLASDHSSYRTGEVVPVSAS